MKNRRTHLTKAQQFRSQQNEDGTHTISGYASLYNVLSNELAPGVREKIAPGAFDGALSKSEVTANVNHDDRFLLGRTSSGTLKLFTDEIGLRFEVTLPDTTYARDLGELMKRGDMQECSFAFTVDPKNIDIERVSETESVETIRSVEELFDVSVVTRGAYSQTFSVYRNLDANDIERAVRNALQTNPQVPESRTAEGSETNHESESRTAKDSDVALALALLDLETHEVQI